MADPFLGEIKIVSFDFAPKGWALCNGQLLPIGQNQALFSLLGTTFGGDGRTTFGLPNLQGRAPVSRGQGGLPRHGRGRGEAHADHRGDAGARPSGLRHEQWSPPRALLLATCGRR